MSNYFVNSVEKNHQSPPGYVTSSQKPVFGSSAKDRCLPFLDGWLVGQPKQRAEKG